MEGVAQRRGVSSQRSGFKSVLAPQRPTGGNSPFRGFDGAQYHMGVARSFGTFLNSRRTQVGDSMLQTMNPLTLFRRVTKQAAKKN